MSSIKLQATDLRHISSLTCEQLQETTSWEQAIRDPELAFSASIPDSE